MQHIPDTKTCHVEDVKATEDLPVCTSFFLSIPQCWPDPGHPEAVGDITQSTHPPSSVGPGAMFQKHNGITCLYCCNYVKLVNIQIRTREQRCEEVSTNLIYYQQKLDLAAENIFFSITV